MRRRKYALLLKVRYAAGFDPRTWIYEHIRKLPHCIRPISFGNRDPELVNPFREKSIDDVAAFREYVFDEKSWLCFFGKSFSMVFHAYTKVPSTLEVYADADFEPHCSMLLSTLDRGQAAWGAAGMDVELKWRNFLKVEMEYAPGGFATGWHGRDHRRYVPGLYWLNYWSHGLIKLHGLDATLVATVLGGTVSPLAHGVLIQLYDRAADWQQRAPAVDAFLEASPNFFSMRRVKVPRLQTPMDTHKLTKLAKDWP